MINKEHWRLLLPWVDCFGCETRNKFQKWWRNMGVKYAVDRLEERVGEEGKSIILSIREKVKEHNVR